MTTSVHAVGPTTRLARFVVHCADVQLDADIAMRSATALLDAFGLGLAAKGDSTLEAYVDLTETIVHAERGCTIWGRAGKVSTLDAVTANALSVHARFQDDCDMTSWAHPGSLIVPAAVALGESNGAKLGQVLRAVACGYATISWLGGDEEVGRGVVERGFRASPVFGSIGAAAAASVMLSLNEEQTHNALAISADLTGGVLEPVGSGADDWRVQNATAAHRGVMSALLAQRGVIGSPRALEGANGLLHTFAGLDRVPNVWERDPDLRSMLNVWAKPYPTLGDNMAVTAATLAIKERDIDVDAIESVEVHQNAHFASYPGTSYRGPYLRPAQAMASTAFAVAATLVHGRLRYDLYRTNLNDARILTLIERVRVVPEKSYGYVDGTVIVVLQDGTRLEQTAADLPRTLFYRDKISAIEAFDALMRETGYDEDRARAIKDTLFSSMETYGEIPVRELVDVLS